MSQWSLYCAHHICRLHTPSRTTSSTSAEIVKALWDFFAKIDVRRRISNKLFQMFGIAYSDVKLGVYHELLEAHEAMYKRQSTATCGFTSMAYQAIPRNIASYQIHGMLIGTSRVW
jgi:hypothetical protein